MVGYRETFMVGPGAYSAAALPASWCPGGHAGALAAYRSRAIDERRELLAERGSVLCIQVDFKRSAVHRERHGLVGWTAGQVVFELYFHPLHVVPQVRVAPGNLARSITRSPRRADVLLRRFETSRNCRDYDVMARSVAVVITDDIDGSPDAQTVTFSFGGATYELDLSEANRAKLDAAVAPYIAAGRRISRGRGRPSTTRASAPKVDRAAVRAWAKENGLTVSERGRISAEVLRQYEATH
jgi:hypothetical protein